MPKAPPDAASTSSSSSDEEGRISRKRPSSAGGKLHRAHVSSKRATHAAEPQLSSRISELEESLKSERAGRETEAAKLAFLVRRMCIYRYPNYLMEDWRVGLRGLDIFIV